MGKKTSRPKEPEASLEPTPIMTGKPRDEREPPTTSPTRANPRGPRGEKQSTDLGSDAASGEPTTARAGGATERDETPARTTPRGGMAGWGPGQTLSRVLSLLRRELRSKESLRYLGFAILSIAITIGIALAFGQGMKDVLETNASNGMHLFGIMTTGIAFFAFMRYLKRKRDILYIQTFIILYFVVYFAIVVAILAIILIATPGNLIYLYSTFGNALILFSAFVLIIFLLNPEVLGISGENFLQIFNTGRHVRVIGVYLFIALTQITGFSLLNLAIHGYAGPEVSGAAYAGTVNGWLDLFYFSTITFVTIGYGDITPLSPAARLSAITQGLMGHVISLLFLAILLLYLSSSIGGKNTPQAA